MRNQADGFLALGHVRLSIRDLSSAGAQPFHDERHGISVVVNGELYGLQELREDLDYEFTSRSDSELIIPLYLQYGSYFLTKLRGEFSLVLYDSRSKTLLAARDRYGIKPLFWTVVDGKLLIASEAKTFLPLGWKPEWDVPSILEDGWLNDERTLFRGVRKIRPGYYMTCSFFEYIQQRQYWDMEYPDKLKVDNRSEDEIVLGLRERLLDSVRLRLESDKPVGIYLSGGIDSSIIAGMTTELWRERKKDATNGSTQWKPVCFSIGFEGKEFDESQVAQRTVDFLGVDLHILRVNEELLASHFAEACWHSEHHNPDLNFIGKFMISALSQKHGFNVVMTGNGADEHFGGYEHYRPDFLREPDLSRPHSGPKANLATLEEDQCNPGYVGTDRSLAVNDPVPRRMLNDTSISAQLWPVTMAHFAPWTSCYGEMSQPRTRANNPDVRVLNLVNTHWHPLHTAQYLEIKSIFTNLDLTCMGDRMEMSHSVEGRTPYLDHEFTAFVNNIPPSLKIKADQGRGNLTQKWVLREAGRPYITAEVYGRRKHVFSAPIQYRRGDHLHRLFERLLTRERVENLGFLEAEKMSGLMERAFEGDSSAMRFVINAAQWVVLSERFNVQKAKPPD